MPYICLMNLFAASEYTYNENSCFVNIDDINRLQHAKHTDGFTYTSVSDYKERPDCTVYSHIYDHFQGS